MWGPFPALRRVLEPKRVPDRYYGPTLVSDTVFSQIERLLTMAILLHENRHEVLEVLKSKTPDRESSERLFMLRQDLEHLHDRFCWASTLFEAAISYLETTLEVTPENKRTQDNRQRQHGIFSLALIVSWYCEKFGDLKDVADERFTLTLLGVSFDDKDTEKLYAKAREWIKKFRLEEEAPPKFEQVWA
jgi:hypothetical protein